MNYFGIVQTIRDATHRHPFVHSFYYEQYTAQDIENIEYPAVILTPETITNSGGILAYSFNLMYVDRLQAGDVNLIEVESVGVDVLQDLLFDVEDELPTGELEDGLSINVFSRQFADDCAGAVLTFTIDIPRGQGECLWYKTEDANECDESDEEPDDTDGGVEAGE